MWNGIHICRKTKNSRYNNDPHLTTIASQLIFYRAVEFSLTSNDRLLVFLLLLLFFVLLLLFLFFFLNIILSSLQYIILLRVKTYGSYLQWTASFSHHSSLIVNTHTTRIRRKKSKSKRQKLVYTTSTKSSIWEMFIVTVVYLSFCDHLFIRCFMFFFIVYGLKRVDCTISMCAYLPSGEK